MADLTIDPNLTIDQDFSTPISVHSETFSTQELGLVIIEAYKGIKEVEDIFLQVYHDDINIKVILKKRPGDNLLNELINRQLTIHEKFNYSFSFNFEYIPSYLYQQNENDSSILKAYAVSQGS